VENEKVKPESMQRLICYEKHRFGTFREAKIAVNDAEILNPAPSKVKIVRRGPRRSNKREYFELRLYNPIKQEKPQKKTEETPKKRSKAKKYKKKS